MSPVTRGFTGRRRDDPKLPPGQYLEHGFPVLQAGPTPPVNPATWTFTITAETGSTTSWNWREFTALPAEDITTDIHCVTECASTHADQAIRHLRPPLIAHRLHMTPVRGPLEPRKMRS